MPSAAEDLLRIQKQINQLLTEFRKRAETDRENAQDAIATLVRLQTAQGLAAQFLERKRPYKDDPSFKALLDDGLLDHAAFIQKPPLLLGFYRRLLFSMDREVRSILEIGVKGGGSTAFWKALFPDATVIGMDLKLRRWVASEPSADGVIYVQGDQTDVARLQEIATQYGPFSIVIDDGSHVTDHQATTMRCLLPQVEPGGFYVVEDIHTSIKTLDGEQSLHYGEDIWSDFTLAVFQHLRKGPAPAPSAGAQLASRLASVIDDLILGSRVLAIRVRPESSSPEQSRRT